MLFAGGAGGGVGELEREMRGSPCAASGISTTNSFYGACACKNWVLASGELSPQVTERGAIRERGSLI